MTDWSTAADDWATAKMGEPGAMPPATMTDVVTANWRTGFFKDPISGAYDTLERQLRAETGQDAATFTDQWGGRDSAPAFPEDRARLIGENLGKLDKGAREAIAPLVDVRARGAEAAQAEEDQQQSVYARTYGIGGNALGWAAYLTRQMIDPVNLAMLPLGGGPLEGSVVKMLGREFVTGAAITAGLYPITEHQRAEVGLPTGGIGDFAEAVLKGGLMQAGLGGLFRGGAAVARRLTGLGVRPPIHPDDLDALAQVAERDQVLSEQATPPTPVARAALPARIDQAAAAIEAGNRAPRELLKLETETAVSHAVTEAEAPTGRPALGPDEIVRANGDRLTVTPKVVELADVTISHTVDGTINPNYPAELQGRDRSSPASRTWVAETAAKLEPALLGRAPTAQEGAPIAGGDGVVEAGNGRALLIARAYDRHPERAAAYRAYLEAQGFSTEGFTHPILVRVRQGEMTPAERVGFASEGNIQRTAKLSATERAFADARLLSEDLLAVHAPGPTEAVANMGFVRGFANQVVAPEERADFVASDNRLSIDGERRMAAALAARGYGDRELVAALHETADPTSRAIIGALADNAPLAARIKSQIEAGRLEADQDPAPALLVGWRLVDRARQTGQKVIDLLDQVDIETGAVPAAVRNAVEMYFRVPVDANGVPLPANFLVAASRPAVAAQIELAMVSALERSKAVGDLFGEKADAAALLAIGRTAEIPPEDLALTPADVATAAAPAAVLLEPPAAAAPAGVILREDAGTAGAGSEFTVIRLGSATGGLAGRNAGNALGVAEHLVRLSDPEAPSFAGGEGDTLSVYSVRLTAEPGSYARSVAGQGVGRESGVGREAKSYGAVAYSFGQEGNGYTSTLLARVPLQKFEDALAAAGFHSADEAGTIETAAAVRQAIEAPAPRAAAAEAAAPPMQRTPEAVRLQVKAATPGPGSVTELIRADASATELGQHPDIVAADAYATGLPHSDKLPGYGTPEFFAKRVYTLENGDQVVGRKAAVDALIKKARSYSLDGPVRNERKATILLGAPAAGKSSLAEGATGLATKSFAAIVDSDDAKKIIPGFEGGPGAGAVHEESSHLTFDVDSVNTRLLDQGANLILPKIGHAAATIQKLIGQLAERGYQVDLISLKVDPDEAYRRMIGRYIRTGRIINDAYYRGIGDKPSATYYMLKGQKDVHEAVEFDGNGPFGARPEILDGADTELARTLQGPGGGGGRGDGSGTQGLAGRAEGPGGDRARGNEPVGGYPGATPEGAAAGAEARLAAEAAQPPPTPTPPIGDPQLAADAQRVVDQVGENFQIMLGDPGEEGRPTTIAAARAELAEDTAAAAELLACVGGTATVAGAGAAVSSPG